MTIFLLNNLKIILGLLIGLMLFAESYSFSPIIRKSSQTSPIENGWMGIKPLQANREIVRKTWTETRIDDNGYYFYETDEAVINLNYSTAPCEPNHWQRGLYRVPENTVLAYIIRPKNQMKLSEVNFQPKEYERTDDGHIANLAHYYDLADGVLITVKIQDGVEYVNKILFRPSKKDEKIQCSNRK